VKAIGDVRKSIRSYVTYKNFLACFDILIRFKKLFYQEFLTGIVTFNFNEFFKYIYIKLKPIFNLYI